MTILMIRSWIHLHPLADLYDHIIFTFFFLCAIKCLICSTLFHIHFCRSEEMWIAYGCLDFAGISMLICGSFSLVTYYSYYGEGFWQTFYMIKIVAVSSVGILGPMFPIWKTAQFRWGRVIVYFFSVVISAYPVISYVISNAAAELRPFLKGWPAVILCYGLGAVIYGTQFPERFAPGKFDIWLHSHQIWHILIVAAVVLQYQCYLNLLEWRLLGE
jgi:adiponectin receptor